MYMYCLANTASIACTPASASVEQISTTYASHTYQLAVGLLFLGAFPTGLVQQKYDRHFDLKYSSKVWIHLCS